MNELAKISGLGNKITIADKELFIKPVRLRDLIDIEEYSKDKSLTQARAYQLYKHLRDNEGITLDFVLDLEMPEVKRLSDEVDKLYPSQKTEGGNN